MNEPLGMSCIKTVCDLNPQIENLGDGEGVANQALTQRVPSRNSITINGWPSYSPASWMVQMLG